MFAVVIAFVFLSRWAQLSAIAKFLVPRFGKGEGGMKWESWNDSRREWEETGEKGEMDMHEKVAQKRNRYGIWGRPLGASRATALCQTSTIFLRATLPHG